ncbi:MAG: NAD-dependent epimerase/dehydratase family protein [Myxococcota bacterium]
MKILVTGGTGLVGCHATAALLGAGHQVRLFVRDPGKVDRALSPLGWSCADVEIAQGDLAGDVSAGGNGGVPPGRAAVQDSLEGCEGLLHCAGLFSPSLEDEARVKQINVEGTRNALGAGAESGVARMVHVSSMLALFPPRGAEMKATDEVAQPRSMYAQTKASAERIARALQESAPLTIIYPAAVHGPNDPTFSIGPQLVAQALGAKKALVTEGGLAYTDVRDLAQVICALFDGAEHSDRLMAPSFFVTHERYRMLLELVTGHEIGAQKMPGFLLRGLGRMGDLAQKFGRAAELNYEAAEVLTRSVPLDDRESVALLGRPKRSDEESFRDLVRWMVSAGHVSAERAGSAAE